MVSHRRPPGRRLSWNDGRGHAGGISLSERGNGQGNISLSGMGVAETRYSSAPIAGRHLCRKMDYEHHVTQRS
jgi:hypothetical protein